MFRKATQFHESGSSIIIFWRERERETTRVPIVPILPPPPSTVDANPL